ncbi:ABC transporter substrate-binding protein [Georgenia sp. MJ170]|uniref:ABC transporter substrate-binding protein n=1 Tax=Georgenia sunbinii TaxID=3117728 RepID=UPI002F26B406
MTATAARRQAAMLAVVTVVLAGCAAGAEETDVAAGTTIVLADPQPLGEYNPVGGYGELGVSPLYDGLLRPQAVSDEQLPALVPGLAAAQPSSNDDSTVWDVPLRSDVHFSDGTSLTADDVVATYEAVLDPASASGIAASYAMIDAVTAVDDLHVRFELAHPYAAFPALLLLGIAPAEHLTGGPALDSPLNRQPVGTGPYVLTDLTAEQAVLEANPDYWAGAPEVTRLVVVHMPDDNARAQRMRAGDIDGTVLPPALARSFENDDGATVHAVQSADWRGVSLPADNPLTADERVRLAMNLGVDRQSMITDVLAGHGRPAHSPAAAVYGDGFDPAATFDHDPDRARALLEDAGWLPEADGVRVHDGARAELTVLYPAPDTVRRDLATAFAADMAELGIDVTLTGSSWDEMDRRVADSAILLGGGDRPYDLDTQMYGALHGRAASTATYDNPAGFQIPGVDDALDDARRTLDPVHRAQQYRAVQRAYVEHPTHVFLAFLDHTYVSVDDGWDTGPLVMEPHAHGVTWGPWWNLVAWHR